MSILSKVTWQAMKKNRTRTIVTIIGVILSAAMFSAVTTAAISIRDFLIRGFVYEEGDYFVNYDYATDQQAEALAREDIVTQLADYKCLGYTALEDNYSLLGAHFVSAVDNTFFETMPVYLTEGRLPENSAEILLSENYVAGVKEYGGTVSLGDTITISMRSWLAAQERYDNTAFLDTIEHKSWEETFTVVGIYEDQRFRASEYNYDSLLTFDDGNQSETLWHRLYVKTSASDAQQILQWDPEQYGARKFLNNDLMQMYGATAYTNLNDLIVYLALILIALIMAASVSLIHNAFSISVSERTKQFGLLASVGATKKQLRRSVLFEAGVISAIGIPIGLLCGYGGIAVLFALLGKNFEHLVSFSVEGPVRLYAAPSWVSFLAAAVVCAVTVLISAWVPARRATKITPLEAIRQSDEIKTRSKDVKVGKLTYKLFGLPGALAKKYFGVSRRKYRTTVISLAFSLVLFVVAGYFSQQLRTVSSDTIQKENFDFDCATTKEDTAETDALFQQALACPGVTKSAVVSTDLFYCIFPTEALNADYRSYKNRLNDDSGDYSCETVHIVYLQDDILSDHLKSEGIDPGHYIGVENPPALLCMMNIDTYEFHEDGSRTRKTYHFAPFTETVKTVTLFDTNGIPEQLTKPLGDRFFMEEKVTDSGELLLEFGVFDFNEDDSRIEESGVYTYFKLVFREDESGNPVVDYYAYDPESGETGALAVTGPAKTTPMEIKIGDVLEQRPFGIRSSTDTQITLILPLSTRRADYQNLYDGQTYLRLNSDSYELTKTSLGAIDGLFVIDQVESSRNARGLFFTVQVCAAGFIILISLICVANVFNTISTNIALRRRDFGMLKSVGMKNREVYRMMSFECVIYGFRAFAWGFPISLALCYGLYLVFDLAYVTTFRPPWLLLLVGTFCIIAVVFASMLYAVGKLKKDNPIEAIRMENL